MDRIVNAASRVVVILLGCPLISCGQGKIPESSAPSATAPAEVLTKPLQIEVDNGDFGGQGGIVIISHEPSAVMLQAIVINRAENDNCMFPAGTEMRWWTHSDWAKLPVELHSSEQWRPPFFLLGVCGEPQTVLLTTDRGTAAYGVADLQGQSVANHFGSGNGLPGAPQN